MQLKIHLIELVIYLQLLSAWDVFIASDDGPDAVAPVGAV